MAILRPAAPGRRSPDRPGWLPEPPEPLRAPPVVEDWTDPDREQPPASWEPAGDPSWFMLRAWRRWHAARRSWADDHRLGHAERREVFGRYPTGRPLWRREVRG